MRLSRCALTLSLIALLAGVFAPVCFTEDVSDPASDVCAAVGHEPGEWICAEPGIHTAVCLRCGEPLSESCSYAEEAFLPTQTSPGRIERTCTVCGNVVTETTLPPEAQSSKGWRMGDVDRDGAVTGADARRILRAVLQLERIKERTAPLADLDEDGRLSAADARLALRTSVELEPVRRHSFSVKVEANATCTAQGSVNCRCTYCGFTELLAVPANGHRWTPATVSSPMRCTVCGEMVTGWTNVEGGWYYFNADGSLPKGETLLYSYVNGYSGWLYLRNGRFEPSYRGALWYNGGRWIVENGTARQAITEAQITLFRAFEAVAEATDPGMTMYEKLWACFNYAKTAYAEYQPRYPHYTEVDWPVLYANDMFVRGGGNCFSYAAAFAYMAKAIGYEDVYCCNSGGHGWAEIDGLVYDPEWSRSHSGYSYFGMSYYDSCDVNYRQAISYGLDWMHVKI